MSKYRDRVEGCEAGKTAATEGKRPAFVSDQHLAFLDELRESGETNMFGAQPYLLDEFDMLTEKDASSILTYWMETFGNPSR